jgi:hypothetical protein
MVASKCGWPSGAPPAATGALVLDRLGMRRPNDTAVYDGGVRDMDKSGIKPGT